MFGCSGGGSDGDAGSIGLGYQSNFLNANQCRAQTVNNGISSQDLASYAVSGNPSSIPSGFSEKITQ
jgi:hypothetical protein